MTDHLVGGGHAIWIGGWTTQIHLLREYLVAGGGPHDIPKGDLAIARPELYLEQLREFSTENASPPMLTPAAAFADGLIFRGTVWLPDPDDLDSDEVSGQDYAEITRILEILKAPQSVIADLSHWRESFGIRTEKSPSPS